MINRCYALSTKGTKSIVCRFFADSVILTCIPLKVLAEIMKLRRACCNLRLAIEDSAIPSSKL
ncbi:hypothetical protein [Candidatus Methylobacter oryzae]|uniref:hypothetical protein n=1 Tax=Candidatus Methylobacter oryzae TaxID=2497749 RepID=UPI001F4F54AB|nr:hypothetical protein [Candidatus Methylobacter oryzae]